MSSHREWPLILVLPVLLASSARAADFALPEVIRFGTDTATLEAALAPLCAQQTTRVIEPPFLPDVEERQLQIDCDGFEFRGAVRHAEFVIRDDVLEMVWILTTAEEEAELLAAMVAAYGPPSHEGDNYHAFVEHRAALRRDIPEVLFYSESLAPLYAEWFDENVGTDD